MANRTWNHARTQGVEHVYLPLTILGAGASAPTLSEGDPGGSYFSIARLALGSYTLTTKDAFLALVHKTLSINAGYQAVFGPASQNATTGVWTFPFLVINDSLSVVAATVTGAGSGYTSLPTLAYNNAHSNVGLVLTPVLSAGTIASVTVTSGGYGSDGTAPTITVSGGGGSAGTVTTTLGTNVPADLPVGRGMHFGFTFRNSSVTP